MPSTRTNRKNNLLATIPRLYKSFSVKFDFNPSQFQGGHTSIIRLTTTGRNCCGYGDRIPAVWFNPSSSGATKNSLHICSAVSGNGNYCYNSGAVARGQWITIEIDQVAVTVGQNYRYSVKINGAVKKTLINTKPREWSNVKVYGGGNFYAAATGHMRNLVITTGVQGKPFVQSIVKIVESNFHCIKVISASLFFSIV